MKVLMIGLGGIGQRHVRNLRAVLGDQVDILAYRVLKRPEVLTEKLKPELGSSLEEKYRIAVFEDLGEALAQAPDVAFICNPNNLHIPAAIAAAEAGCHLFVEKPLSHNLEGIEELCRVVEKRNLVALVAYQMRFHPCLLRVKALLEQARVGRILAVRAEVGEHMPSWHTYEDYRQLYASRRDLGGGVILSQIHEMDYLYWLFGLPSRVFALGGHRSGLDIDVEDTASILMDCSGVPVHLHQDYLQRPPVRTLGVVGDEGKILVDFRAPKITVFDGMGTVVESDSFEGFEPNHVFIEELRHFLACIEGSQKPRVSLRDGAQSVRMALAALESLETGHVVELR